jgi:hypothetical protein
VQGGPFDCKEDGTTEHAEYADGSGALLGEDDPFDLKPRLAEIEQQTEIQAGGFPIVQALCAVNVVDHLGHLQFNQNNALDE